LLSKAVKKMHKNIMADDDQTIDQSDEAKAEETVVASDADTSSSEATPEETPAEEAKVEEPKTEEAPKEEVKPEVNVSANLKKIIEQIEKLSVLELSELVHALEERFGVSAAPTMMAGAAPAAAGEPAEEQTTFNVVLADGGANKISVIKAVREIVPTLGLTEAKGLVDTAPKPILEGVGKEAANEAKAKLEAAGAKVELQ